MADGVPLTGRLLLLEKFRAMPGSAFELQILLEIVLLLDENSRIPQPPFGLQALPKMELPLDSSDNPCSQPERRREGEAVSCLSSLSYSS